MIIQTKHKQREIQIHFDASEQDYLGLVVDRDDRQIVYVTKGNDPISLHRDLMEDWGGGRP